MSVPEQGEDVMSLNMDLTKTRILRCIAALMVLCARGEHLYHEERVLLANYSNGVNPMRKSPA